MAAMARSWGLSLGPVGFGHVLFGRGRGLLGVAPGDLVDMAPLDGSWKVERTGGLLPPLLGVRKVIGGATGETRVGPLPPLRFDVRGLELHYRGPLRGLVDLLEPDGDGFRGRAILFGRELGRFRMRGAD
jgi:hypothetical protein